MNTKKHHWILYSITVTIVLTISVQLYWNYNNYLENKQRVKNEIQTSLDIAIDEYYTTISKNNFFAIVNQDSIDKKNIFKNILRSNISNPNSKFNISITADFKAPRQLDSLIDIHTTKSFHYEEDNSSKRNLPKQVKKVLKNIKADSLKLIKGLQSVVVALTNDLIDFNKLDSILNQKLISKGLHTRNYLSYYENDIKTGGSLEKDQKKLTLFLKSKSTFLRPNQSLRIYYQDPTLIALKKSATEIFLSLILSLTIISSLFYLFRIIKKQKQLSEIKNDLINNITHEFKTPIATISTAIEAIENFNVINDREKTKQYAAISALQLKKLHQMVEKLLETATLDSENLMLQKEPSNLVDLIFKIVKKHELLTKKNLNFTTNTDAIILEIDPFHFENAISNVIDNAVKYGGNRLEVTLTSMLNTVEISVTDNGDGIEKNQQERIFDKFYRVPKGNTHDVKGFGIGLYYTHKIIEKHGGEITVLSNFEKTTFKLLIPNE